MRLDYARLMYRVVGIAVLLLIAPATNADRDERFRIRTLSSRPQLISGGDALVEISVPRGVRLHEVSAFLNGREVTSAFRLGTAQRALLGVVDGLALGRNVLEVRVNRHGHRRQVGRLVLTNHAISGPVISAPQQTPFFCETQALELGEPLDANCTVNTVVDYFYRSTVTNKFQPLDPAAPPPNDLAQTTTSEGRTVPYIVRREMGTINRAVYLIAFLHPPGQPLPDPWTSTPGWNRKLVYSFGGGCQAGYHQGRSVGGLGPAPGDTDMSHLEEWQVGYKDYLLSRGYAVAASSLNVFGTSCSDLISAESMMMVKEHFIKRFGLPRFTVGAGGSGGSMQQAMIAQNYPGLLDGIIPGRVYPDNITFLQPLFDCELLSNAFDSSPLAWTSEQKTVVSGKADFNYCTNNGTRYPNLRPTNCDPMAIPPELIYDPVTRPRGVRCTYQDNMLNVYGQDPLTGFARRPFDNVGVQYGLAAFNDGLISFEQFADLNARIGGHDIDGRVIPERTVADLEALRIAYRTGRINEGGGGLASVPIIDLRSYLDGTGDVHDAYHTQILRARLIAAGNARNQVIATVASTGALLTDLLGESSPLQAVTRTMLDAMDQWLENIANDHSHRPLSEKVARNKPADLVDACYTATLERITDLSQCAQLFPYFSDPRIVAGATWADDRLKCSLKPIDERDYAQPLTGEQLDILRTIFPTGVCDYGRRGVEQQPIQGTWLTYPRPSHAEELDREDDSGDE